MMAQVAHHERTIKELLDAVRSSRPPYVDEGVELGERSGLLSSRATAAAVGGGRTPVAPSAYGSSQTPSWDEEGGRQAAFAVTNNLVRDLPSKLKYSLPSTDTIHAAISNDLV